MTTDKPDLKREPAAIQSWNVELNQIWCKGCYLCIDVCPIEGTFTKGDEIGSRGFRPIVVRSAGCTNCQLCELLCPDLAIEIMSGSDSNIVSFKKVTYAPVD